MTSKTELKQRMHIAITNARSDYLDAVGGDEHEWYADAATEIAIQFAAEAVKEQRDIMSRHLNMRNVPQPKV